MAATGTQSTTDDGGGIGELATTVLGSPAAHRAVRVFTAGVAGIAAGVLIAWILVRAHRRTKVVGV